jgi:hypothetical protein
MATTPKNKPFHVHTTDGNFTEGHDSEDAAKADAELRNSRAEALGIATRYTAGPK